VTAPEAFPGSGGVRVVTAGPGDAPALVWVIAGAFRDLEVSRWLVPDPAERREVFPGYFAIYVEAALDGGTVLTTPGRDAAALWLPVGAGGPGELPEGHRESLAAVSGRHIARFEAFDAELSRSHPRGTAHEHLAVLAVRPDRQRLGIGTALLGARHRVLDAAGTPSYLEASDLAKREIYLRHGYADLGGPVRLPGGTAPAMYPMWREPRGGRTSWPCEGPSAKGTS
jgi:GNAT superfamily N-acetyltransferase